jgi:hypothetical protein
VKADAQQPNGQLTEDMRWARDRTGWAPTFEQPAKEGDDEETLLDHRTFLEGKLDDKFFGGWCELFGLLRLICADTSL